MNLTPAENGGDGVATLAAWMAWGLQQGFLRPLEVHGFADGPRPSKRSLTMHPDLIEAMKGTARV